MKAIAMLGLTLLQPVQAHTLLDFDSRTPSVGWHCGRSGAGSSHWGVLASLDAASPPNYLKHVSAGGTAWCARSARVPPPGSLGVKVRIDDALPTSFAGLAWRWDGIDNHAAVRLAGVPAGLEVYEVIDGRRHVFARLTLPLRQRRWHALEVRRERDLVTFRVDGRPVWSLPDAARPRHTGVALIAGGSIGFDDFQLAPQAMPGRLSGVAQALQSAVR